MNKSKLYRVTLAGLWGAFALSVAGCGSSQTPATEIAYQGESQEPVDGELKALWEQIERLKQELLAKSDQDSSEEATEDNDVGETGQDQDCLLPGDCVKVGQPPVVAPTFGQVLETNPSHEKDNVNPGQPVMMVKFSKDVDMASLDNTLTVEIIYVSGEREIVPVTKVSKYMGISSAAYIQLNLKPSMIYSVTIKGGADGVKSPQGTPVLAEDYVFGFVTGA